MSAEPTAACRSLVAELSALGVELWEEGGRLRYRALQGTLTELHLARMKAHKAQLLDYLRDPFSYALSPSRPEEQYAIFPLTDVQASYLLGRKSGVPYGGVGCHAYVEYRLPADVEPDTLSRAWDALTDRHPALRSVFHAEGQQVLAQVSTPRPQVIDLRAAHPEEVEQAMAAVRSDMGQRSYDPATWPLFEVRLSRLPGQTLVHLSIDLLVADFASVQQLLSELEQLCGDPTRLLDAPRVTFRDYVLAERRLRDTRRYARDRDYWSDRLQSLPAAPELPVMPGASTTTEGVLFEHYQALLSAAESSQLQTRSKQRELTPSAVIATAYAEVLGCWGGGQRFTLNVPVFAKKPLHPDVGSVVGDFTSVTLLAVEIEPTLDFTARARKLALQLYEDLDHALFSGVEVLREAAKRSGTFASHLMPVVFTSTLGADTRQKPAAVAGRVVYGLTQTPQVLIDCQIMSAGDELMLSWDVRQGAFPEGLARDAFEAFAGLVRRLASEEGVWHARDLQLLPERHLQTRLTVNTTAAPLPNETLQTRPLQMALRQPERLAVIAPDRELTYAELFGRACALARHLRELGVRPGDRVAVTMDKGWQQVVAVYGTLLAEAVYVPIDLVHPPARRTMMRTAAGCIVAITNSASSEQVETELLSATAVVDVDTSGVDPIVFDQNCPLDPDCAAYVIFTSGSTGMPKGVVISHRAALNTVLDIDRRFEVGPHDRVLGLAQLGFDLSVFDIFGTLSAGACLVLPDPARRSDPSHWVECLAQHGVTLWNSVPAQFHMLYDYLAGPFGGSALEQLGALRLALLSGDWIAVQLPQQMRTLLPGLTVVSLGGATEAAIWSIYHVISERSEVGCATIPYGTPLANQAFHVLDPALRPCPEWVPGELCIAGAGLALGYLDAQQTAAAFIQHPVTGRRLYRTGDFGRYLPSGAIEFLGRRDHQVKIRGHRIELGDIEHALSEHRAVSNAVVVPVGEGRPTGLCAFVELAAWESGEGAAEVPVNLRSCCGAIEALVAQDVTPERVAALSEALDRAALAAMLGALRDHGLFVALDRAHTEAEVLDCASSQHRHVMRRWLRALVDRGWLLQQAESRYCLHSSATLESPEQAWQALAELWGDDLGAPALLAYLRDNALQLKALMAGSTPAVQLLFPEGDPARGDAAYSGNIMSRYMNRVVAAVVREIGRTRAPEPLRVLELGAGTGATTQEVLAALAGVELEYAFTDISPFFLQQARERFRDDARLHYQVLDVEAPFSEQGIFPNCYDVVIAAGVLNNVRDTPAVLAAIAEVLRPEGRLILTEPTREHYEILISQAFMMKEAMDARREADRTFLSLTEWVEALKQAGGQLELCLPEDSSRLIPLGQHVLCARFKHAQRWVEPTELLSHLDSRLPDYMVPQDIWPLDKMLLTANGKVARAELSRWAARRSRMSMAHAEQQPPTGPADLLAHRLAALFSEALLGKRVPARQNLFELGADSLVIAQVTSRIVEQVQEAAQQPFDTLLRQILNQPTIAELSDYLKGLGTSAEHTASAGRPAGSPSAVIPLGGSPPKPREVMPVLVHEALGTMGPYQDFIARLGHERAVAGLAIGDVQALLSIPVETLFEQLAAEHVRQLLELHAGPFRIVGYCVGGQIAIEIARQLAEVGAEVDGLSLVSSVPPTFVPEDELLVEHAFVKVLGLDAQQVGYFRDETQLGRALQTILAKTPGRIPEGSLVALADDLQFQDFGACMKSLLSLSQQARLARIAHAVAGGAEAQHIPGLYRVYRHAFIAAAHHRPAAYAGDVTLVSPTGQLPILSGFSDTSGAYWAEVCLGELKQTSVPGDHFSCMRDPVVGQVVELSVGSV